MDQYAPRTVADLTNDPPPPHLIKNVCRENGSILLYGRTGIGKSRFLWQLACGWAAGRETFGLAPLRPLRISFVEADMFRIELESMIKEYAAINVTPSPSLYWFSRDDTTPFFVDGSFGQALARHNAVNDIDLTIYDAIPDIHLGDPNDSRTAASTLRALHAAAVGKAYLGVVTQRKGSPLVAQEEKESPDEMLGSQAWGRSASTIWQMTNVPSLVWVKHRLCQRPDPIIFKVSPKGVFHLKSESSQGIIQDEAAKGFTSINDLATRIQARDDYRALAYAYKDRALRDLISQMLQAGKLGVPEPPMSSGSTMTTP